MCIRDSHIWVVTVPANSEDVSTPIQLTSGNFDDGEMVWRLNGSGIYFLTEHVDEPYYEPPATDIYSVPVSGGAAEKLASVPMGIHGLVLSPDGRKFVFHGSVEEPVRSYSQPDLWLMDVSPGAKPQNLTANYDFDMGSSVFGDNAPPRGGRGHIIHWSPDGRWVYDIVEKQGRTPIVRVNVESGAVTEFTHGDEAVLDLSTNPNATSVVALISTPVMIGDLFSIGADGSQTRITDFNRKLWSQLDLTEPEEINYKSFDGTPIQGWIQKPPDFDPQKKYPLILDLSLIHI